MMTYYPIDEKAARHAKQANSFSDYKEGSATAEYQNMVHHATAIAEAQKAKTDPMYHEKINALLETYCRKLAENINHRNAIDARVPSILIAGGSNFPTRAKEKQNAARDKNMSDYNYIQGLLDKIRGVGTGGISSDDPQAIEKLKVRLEKLENNQETMKKVNTYYRKYKTLEGCTLLPDSTLQKLKAAMASSWRTASKPFESYVLSNNNANIKRIKQRIVEIEKKVESPAQGWTFEGGIVKANISENRLQVLFDSKPDETVRSELKSSGFRWAPSQGAWQRQLTNNAMYTAKRLKILQPITG